MKVSLKNICTIFLCSLVLTCGQNCTQVKFKGNGNPPPARHTTEGGGGVYDGKVTFYLNESSVTHLVALPGATGGFAITPNLPAGLTINSSTGLISGTPTELSDYKTYAVSANSSSGPIEGTLILGVGSIYQVSSSINGLGLADADLTDGLCEDRNSQCSFQAALDQAHANGIKSRILLPAATYSLNGTELVISKPIEIAGISPAQTLLDGQLLARVMRVTAAGTSLKNLTIRRGHLGSGGKGAGLSLEPVNGGQNILLENVVIEMNVLEDIGAVGRVGSGAGLFVGNAAGVRTIIRNSIIRNNQNQVGSGTAVGGGGIYSEGYLEIVDSEISGNYSIWAGGLYLTRAQRTAITRSRIVNNRAFIRGGGLATFGGSIRLEISASEISGNVAENDTGGGLYLHALPEGFIENSTISNNSAPRVAVGRGGAIFVNGPSVDSFKIHHATIVNNSAGLETGGIYYISGAATSGFLAIDLENSVIASNTGGNCSSDAVKSLGYNAEDGLSCRLTETEDVLTNPFLSALQFLGGTTQVHGFSSPTSAVINFIPAARCLPFDQRGSPRAGLNCAAGAYEP